MAKVTGNHWEKKDNESSTPWHGTTTTKTMVINEVRHSRSGHTGHFPPWWTGHGRPPFGRSTRPSASTDVTSPSAQSIPLQSPSGQPTSARLTSTMTIPSITASEVLSPLIPMSTNLSTSTKVLTSSTAQASQSSLDTTGSVDHASVTSISPNPLSSGGAQSTRVSSEDLASSILNTNAAPTSPNPSSSGPPQPIMSSPTQEANSWEYGTGNPISLGPTSSDDAKSSPGTRPASSISSTSDISSATSTNTGSISKAESTKPSTLQSATTVISSSITISIKSSQSSSSFGPTPASPTKDTSTRSLDTMASDMTTISNSGAEQSIPFTYGQDTGTPTSTTEIMISIDSMTYTKASQPETLSPEPTTSATTPVSSQTQLLVSKSASPRTSFHDLPTNWLQGSMSPKGTVCCLSPSNITPHTQQTHEPTRTRYWQPNSPPTSATMPIVYVPPYTPGLIAKTTVDPTSPTSETLTNLHNSMELRPSLPPDSVAIIYPDGPSTDNPLTRTSQTPNQKPSTITTTTSSTTTKTRTLNSPTSKTTATPDSIIPTPTPTSCLTTHTDTLSTSGSLTTTTTQTTTCPLPPPLPLSTPNSHPTTPVLLLPLLFLLLILLLYTLLRIYRRLCPLHYARTAPYCPLRRSWHWIRAIPLIAQLIERRERNRGIRRRQREYLTRNRAFGAHTVQPSGTTTLEAGAGERDEWLRQDMLRVYGEKERGIDCGGGGAGQWDQKRVETGDGGGGV